MALVEVSIRTLFFPVYLLPYIEVKEKYITDIRSHANPVNYHAYANQTNNYNVRRLMSYNVMYRLQLKHFFW